MKYLPVLWLTHKGTCALMKDFLILDYNDSNSFWIVWFLRVERIQNGHTRDHGNGVDQ